MSFIITNLLVELHNHDEYFIEQKNMRGKEEHDENRERKNSQGIKKEVEKKKKKEHQRQRYIMLLNVLIPLNKIYGFN